MIFPAGTPDDPLSQTFVCTAFGFGPPYSLKAVCGNNPGINIFSWYKPKEYDNPVMPQSARDSLPGLKYNYVSKFIYYDKPTTYFRLMDFAGYDPDARAPDVDTTRTPVVYIYAGNTLSIDGTPYWGDYRYKWNKILGDYTYWEKMMLMIEVYDKNKVLLESKTVKILDILLTSHWVITISKVGISSKDPGIYVKGYFCDYSGFKLAPMPTNTDGFVFKRIEYTQLQFFYTGSITSSMHDTFIGSTYLDLGEGGETSAGRLNFVNATNNDYTSGSFKPRMGITVTDKATGAQVASRIVFGSPSDCPGPGMTRTWAFPHVDVGRNGSFRVNVVASVEYY